MIAKPFKDNPKFIATYLFAILLAVASMSRPIAAHAEETQNKEAGEKERRKDVRMPFLTAAVDAGLVFLSDINLDAKDNGVPTKLKVSPRSGVIAKLHLNLLGDGLGIEINPFVSAAWTGDNDIEKIIAVGVQLGVAYRFRIRRFYPKIGVGGHLAYLGGDIDHGLEAYGRFPIGFTIYFLRFLGFDMEVAYMTGTTGIKTEGMGVFDKIQRYDYSHGLEVVIGLRFP